MALWTKQFDISLFSAVYHSILSSDPLHHLASPQVLLEKYPVSLAITTELCAGIVDKTKTLIEIAQEEILEECGYNVPVERIEVVMTYRQVLHNFNLHSLLIEVDYETNKVIWTALLFNRAGVGTNGSIQTLYYVEVTDDDKAAEGGGVDDEIIDVLEQTLDQCRDMLKQGAVNNAPPSCLLGISWFLANKANQWIFIPLKIPTDKFYVFQNLYEKKKFWRFNAQHAEFSDKFAIKPREILFFTHTWFLLVLFHQRRILHILFSLNQYTEQIFFATDNSDIIKIHYVNMFEMVYWINSNSPKGGHITFTLVFGFRFYYLSHSHLLTWYLSDWLLERTNPTVWKCY